MTTLRRESAADFHERRIARIARTAPLVARRTGLLYAGLIGNRDMRSWLVALKSIATSVGDGEFAVIDDGSLTEQDHALLAAHLPGLRVIAAARIDTTGFPDSAGWRQLLAMLDLARDHYVLQVDSDLVALDQLDEVAAAVRQDRACIACAEPGAVLRTAVEASARARDAAPDDVQIASERLLDALPDAASLRYVRGSAGIAGVPKGCDPAPLAMLSRCMGGSLGARWHEPGSARVGANFLIANTPDPVLLPFQRYPTFGGAGHDLAQTALVHFPAPRRYEGRVFTRASRLAIARLPMQPEQRQTSTPGTLI